MVLDRGTTAVRVVWHVGVENRLLNYDYVPISSIWAESSKHCRESTVRHVFPSGTQTVEKVEISRPWSHLVPRLFTAERRYHLVPKPARYGRVQHRSADCALHGNMQPEQHPALQHGVLGNRRHHRPSNSKQGKQHQRRSSTRDHGQRGCAHDPRELRNTSPARRTSKRSRVGEEQRTVRMW